jgi:hypothetical protein
MHLMVVPLACSVLLRGVQVLECKSELRVPLTEFALTNHKPVCICLVISTPALSFEHNISCKK